MPQEESREPVRSLPAGDNFRAYCPDVDLGGGRAITCLNENAGKLTPDCRDALAKLAR
jgi:hypothetical protein